MQIYEPYFIDKDKDGKACHKYESPSGEKLDSVTKIIRLELGLPSGKWLQPYAELGKEVDDACVFYDEGDLNWNTLDEENKPYVEQYVLAKKHHGIQVLQNRIKRYSPLYKIAGEIDKICIINGCIWVLDLKTTKKCHIHHKWQTAPYLKMVSDELSEKFPGMPQKRGCLYLLPDNFFLVGHIQEQNFNEFLAFYASVKIRIRDGYTTKRTQVEWDM